VIVTPYRDVHIQTAIIAGWASTIGWNANSAAGVFFGATMIQGLLVLNDSSGTYDAPRWQGTLLMYGALLVVIVVNTIGARLLPKIEGLAEQLQRGIHACIAN
jgi:choline transport protein